MTSILRTRNRQIIPISAIWIMVILVCLWVPVSASAQSSQTLSISPTLFDVSASPSQNWSSGLKVINSNRYDLTVYVEIVNFVPSGESGQGTFVPITEEAEVDQTVAQWIKPEAVEYTIRAEQTLTIPFTVTVPENAPPGGHYAAILVGTKPPSVSGQNTAVVTSQTLASLLFLRVSGEIVEQGKIRSFSVRQRLIEKPEAIFNLRFENSGNVHVQPRGEIKIFNMWGQERGVIPINQDNLYGNVLANSVRNYTYEWRGEWSLADVGLYRAVTAVAYGLDEKKFDSAELTFFVLPWKPLLLVILFFVGFISLVVWSIKLYIRRVLELAGVTPGLESARLASNQIKHRRVSLTRPIEEGILDLREQMSEATTTKDKLWSAMAFLRDHKQFFIFVLAVILFLFIAFWYISLANVDKRSYEVTIEGQDGGLKVSSEQIEYDKLSKGRAGSGDQVKPLDFPAIRIVNQSGESGAGARLRLQLESRGYQVSNLSSDLFSVSQNTVIVYSPPFADEALELSRQIQGAMLSAYDETTTTADYPITVYVGRKYENSVE